MQQKTFTMHKSEKTIQDLVHNEPVIYRSILFAQKAQVSVGAKHQKGISCNPRKRGNERITIIHLPTLYTALSSILIKLGWLYILYWRI